MWNFASSLNGFLAYKASYLKGDLFAGFTVGVMLLPQGMAYALLAGLPPIYGLYAATIPLATYAILGTSRHLAVGPVALDAMLIFSGVSTLATPGSDEYISYVMLLTLMVGLIQFFMGLFKMGFLVNFLSRPVISGFTSAAAIIIAMSQVPHLLGIELPRSGLGGTVQGLFENISNLSGSTLLLGIGSILLLLTLKKYLPKWPRLLISVLFGIAAVIFFTLDTKGVRVLGQVPSGFPVISWEFLDWSKASYLLPMAFTLALIGFMESIAVGKSMESKVKTYEIEANQELHALGLANVFSSFIRGMPVSGGFSRSAVNLQSGARTGLASLLSAMVVLVSLLYLTSYFFYLPFTVLAAIIIVSVMNLIDVSTAKLLWRTDRKDFCVFLSTALVTIIFGIKEGITFGLLLSLALLIYKESYPHIAELARVPNTKEYRNVKRFTGLESYPGVLIFRFDALLYFANANRLRDYIRSKINTHQSLKYLILDAGAISTVDSTAMQVLQEITEELENRGIAFYMVDVKGPVRDTFSKNEFLKQYGAVFFALNVDKAMERILNDKESNFDQYLYEGS